MFKTESQSAFNKGASTVLSFDLKGVSHRLQNGESIIGVDHGGSGADGFVGIYDQSADEVQVKFRKKFKPEISPQQVLLQLKDNTGVTVNRVLYGVAAPVNNNECATGVNVPFAVSGAVLRAVLPEHPHVAVYNDYGLVMERFKAKIADQSQVILKAADYRCFLYPGVITAIGPGSGLGVGRLTFLPDNKYLLEQIEGSHGRLATRCDNKNESIQAGLINWWTACYGSVNSDTVLCASGLLKLLRYIVGGCNFALSPALKQLMDESRDSQPILAHEDHLLMTEYALNNKDLACEKALHLFMDLLGGFTQNAAFLHGLRARDYKIYLAGGVITGLLNHANFIDQFVTTFIDSFLDTREEKDAEWLRDIQIAILKQPRAEALYGAAIAAACMNM